MHQAGAELEEDQNRHQAGDELSNGNRQQAVDDLKDGEILHQAGVELEEDQNRHQAGDELSNGNRHQAGDELRGGEILQQPVAKFEDSQNRQQLVDEFKMLFSIPWGHHVEIFTHAQSVEEARFYISKTLENGWSRNVLANMMEADLYHTQGTAITNFAEKLPAPESDLAQQTLKDPYCFDFIALRKRYTERELEDALMENITRFLLELGNGFSFIGRQYRLEVGGEEFFIDLLFYHLNLRRYVVVELKAGEFKPTDAGQLGFYVKAVNEQLKHPGDNDAIGLIICRQKNRLVAEYALKSSTQLLGISEYRLTKLLPRNFKSSLPSIQDIESQFTADEAQVGSKGPQVEPHAIVVTDHRTSKPNRTSKPTSNRTSKPTSNRTSKPTSNIQVEAQVGSSSRPQVEAHTIDITSHPTSNRISNFTNNPQLKFQINDVSDHPTSNFVNYPTCNRQVRRLICSINKELTRAEIMDLIKLKDRVTFLEKYLKPALLDGLIELTQPNSPRSPTQKYRLTVKGKAVAKKLKREEGKK